MHLTETPLAGDFVIDIQKIRGERGFFGRSWCAEAMGRAGLETHGAQIKTSLSRFKGTLRGMHFRIAPFQQRMMIRRTRGAAFDTVTAPLNGAVMLWPCVGTEEGRQPPGLSVYMGLRSGSTRPGMRPGNSLLGPCTHARSRGSRRAQQMPVNKFTP